MVVVAVVGVIVGVIVAVVVGQAGAGAFVRVPKVVSFVFAQREAPAQILCVFGRDFEADAAEEVQAAAVAGFVALAAVFAVNRVQSRWIAFERRTLEAPMALVVARAGGCTQHWEVPDESQLQDCREHTVSHSAVDCVPKWVLASIEQTESAGE